MTKEFSFSRTLLGHPVKRFLEKKKGGRCCGLAFFVHDCILYNVAFFMIALYATLCMPVNVNNSCS